MLVGCAVGKAVLPWSEFDRLLRAMCVGSHVGDEWDRPTLTLLLSRTMQVANQMKTFLVHM